jgi:hypothetical protein
VGTPLRYKVILGVLALAFVAVLFVFGQEPSAPVRVGENQIVLLLGEVHGEDVEAEQGYEPRSFLARQVEIPPGATARGSVTFDISDAGLEALARDGNLDIGNFGATSADYEPERLFEEPELGVIRTYRKAMIG